MGRSRGLGLGVGIEVGSGIEIGDGGGFEEGEVDGGSRPNGFVTRRHSSLSLSLNYPLNLRGERRERKRILMATETPASEYEGIRGDFFVLYVWMWIMKLEYSGVILLCMVRDFCFFYYFNEVQDILRPH